MGYQDQKKKAKQFINGQWNQFGDILEKFFSLCGNLFMLVGTGFIVTFLELKGRRRLFIKREGYTLKDEGGAVILDEDGVVCCEKSGREENLL